MKHWTKNIVLFFCVQILSFALISGSPALIKSVEVQQRSISIAAEDDFARTYLTSDFFIQYPDNDLDLTTLDTTVIIAPFIMNVIPMVWASGKTYYVEQMDEDLYHSLELIRSNFYEMYPGVDWSGKLEVGVLKKNKFFTHLKSDQDPKIALLFSCGLDAVHASFTYRDHKQLLVTVWGSDVRVNDTALWLRVQEKCEDYAQKYGYEQTWVRSNLRRFINSAYLNGLYPEIPKWIGGTLQGLGYIGVTIPFLAAKGIAHVLISSSRTSEFPYPYGTHPLIESNITCAGIQAHHVCTDEERVEKVDYIKNACKKEGLQKPFLRVCWGNSKIGGNCCKCIKCLLTINEIAIAGEDPREYGFDISLDKIEKRTKKLVEKSDEPLNHGWHWEYARQTLKKNLEAGEYNSEIYEKLRNYFLWYLQVPQSRFEILRTKPQVVSLKDRLESLWHSVCKKSDESLKRYLDS